MVRRKLTSRPLGFRMEAIEDNQSAPMVIEGTSPQLEEGEIPVVPGELPSNAEVPPLVTGVPEIVQGPVLPAVSTLPPPVTNMGGAQVENDKREKDIKRSRALLNSKFVMAAMLQQRSRLFIEKGLNVAAIEERLWRAQSSILDMEEIFIENYGWDETEWQSALQDGEMEAVLRVTSIFQSGITTKTPVTGIENSIILNEGIHENTNLNSLRNFTENIEPTDKIISEGTKPNAPRSSPDQASLLDTNLIDLTSTISNVATEKGRSNNSQPGGNMNGSTNEQMNPLITAHPGSVGDGDSAPTDMARTGTLHTNLTASNVSTNQNKFLSNRSFPNGHTDENQSVGRRQSVSQEWDHSTRRALEVIRQKDQGTDYLAPFMYQSERIWLEPWDTDFGDENKSTHYMRRLSNAKIPTFSGDNTSKDTVTHWLSKVAHALFVTVGIPRGKAVTACMEAFPLQTTARIWVLNLRQAKPDLSFDDLAHAMVDRFYSPLSRATAEDDLAKLYQDKKPIGQFIDEHSKLWNRVNAFLSEDSRSRDLLSKLNESDTALARWYMEDRANPAEPLAFSELTQWLVREARQRVLRVAADKPVSGAVLTMHPPPQQKSNESNESAATKRPRVPCDRGCKFGSHTSGTTCPAIGFTCHACDTKGHFAKSKMCPKYDPNFVKGSNKEAIKRNKQTHATNAANKAEKRAAK